MFEEFAPYRTYFIVAFVAMIVWNLFYVLRAALAWRARDKFAGAFYTYMAVALLWPTSLIAKVLIVGPDIFRWYAGDIGFVLMAPAMFKLRMSVPPHRLSAQEPLSSVYKRAISNLMITRNMVLFMTLVITGYEVFVGVLYKMNPEVEPIGIGSFDPFDVAMYFFGAYLGAKMLNIMADKFRELLKLSEAREAQVINELRTQQRQSRPRAKKARRHHNPSRK